MMPTPIPGIPGCSMGCFGGSCEDPLTGELVPMSEFIFPGIDLSSGCQSVLNSLCANRYGVHTRDGDACVDAAGRRCRGASGLGSIDGKTLVLGAVVLGFGLLVVVALGSGLRWSDDSAEDYL